MSYEITYKNNDTQLWVVYSDTLTLSEIEESWVKRMENVDRFKKASFVIADYSNASLKQISSDDVRKGGKWPQLASKINPDITLIVITSNKLEFGFTRMWGTYASQNRMPWKIVFVKSYEELNKILND